MASGRLDKSAWGIPRRASTDCHSPCSLCEFLHIIYISKQLNDLRFGISDSIPHAILSYYSKFTITDGKEVEVGLKTRIGATNRTHY